MEPSDTHLFGGSGPCPDREEGVAVPRSWLPNNFMRREL